MAALLMTNYCEHGYDTPKGCPMCRREVAAETQAAIDGGYAASPMWGYMAIKALERIATANQTLTADDVMHELESGVFHTRDNRAMGAIMKEAQHKGWIRPLDQFVPSTNKRKHQSPTRVWESIIYDGRLF